MFELLCLGLSVACLVMTVKNHKEHDVFVSKYEKLKLDYAVLKTKYKYQKERG